MRKFSISPAEMLISLWRNRSLVRTLIQREVVGRYRGSIMGILWSFFNPILMLVVYTFVFSVIFKARWSGGSESKTEFSLVLFAGLIIYNLFAECVNKSPTLITSHINYVKKVIFPLEILPWVVLGSAMFHAIVSLGVWLIAYSILFGVPNATVLLFPLILLPLAMFIMGITWTLASLGVYLRDIAHFIGTITTLMMFLSPIFYSIDVLPEEYRPFFMANPLTPIIEQTRNVLFFGISPNFSILAVYFLGSILIGWTGFICFQKTRKGFADVL
ncbi:MULTISPECIES: ABC transporter permease [unclassified Pseudomonas]|uniref:ABC transporter permease n=1 Tax=unclassified Pseudomonas TaxID=196821 RepID=UPI0008763FAA|nr:MULTISPECIES: ABC transporter permease [unclassified Pseudomonas]SCZ75398.1 lipopolysaccharide transport system permease protein [Pseudomonas sp. NFPP17]SDA88633.1 lipopolysaccharide transport system permease protein [Pseudomonas sp. NFPP15]SEL96817.1 lipopolysaccharide transport system permease protein [Pseudomonas sp. NFPP18]SFA68100.1 lipopolysaccharide transport system permease protein [Pseudomonas sp. NFPP13]SFU11584.1 lipopolysaccharide transport system permease protein [Pseudomonas s